LAASYFVVEQPGNRLVSKPLDYLAA